MFVQVIQAQVADPEGLREEWERWQREVMPEAIGFLGATSGITDDRKMIVIARFSSAEEARRNSGRPQQDEAWTALSKHLAGGATFHDCTDVEVVRGGGSDDAGFVQVIQGTPRDPARYRELSERMEELMPDMRPDVIGGLVAWHPDGGVTEVIYFTSEKEAREGEARPRSPEVESLFQEWMSLMPDITFFDLREPWMVSR